MHSSPVLTHIDSRGQATMVDVSNKGNQRRVAVARGHIRLGEETLTLIRSHALTKGSVLDVARLAGIQGAKQTPHLIPLCHPVFLSQVTVDLALVSHGVEATCTAVCVGPTGVEMEALAGVAIALLTVYDMCKAVDSSMVIENIHLVSKIKEAAAPQADGTHNGA